MGAAQNAFLGGYDIGLPQDFSSQADMLNDLLRQRQFQSSPNLQSAPKFGVEQSPDMLQQGTGTRSPFPFSDNAFAFSSRTAAVIPDRGKYSG